MEQITISIVSDELGPRAAARLMTSIIVPRPIGWISTIGAQATPNLAPFSFFNGVAASPPTVMISVGEREGKPKDTLRNARETGEFVVNIVDEELASSMNQTSIELPYGVNEFDFAGLAAEPSVDVSPPRVARALIAMEARVTQIVPVGGTRHTMILGRILRFHIRDGLLRADGLVDARMLRPVARLGGDEYAMLAKFFSMPRPKL